jgi:hypothetical protein
VTEEQFIKIFTMVWNVNIAFFYFDKYK